jgi:hypothetical protein
MNCGIGSVLSKPRAMYPRMPIKISERPNIRNKMVSHRLNALLACLWIVLKWNDSTSRQPKIRCTVDTFAIARRRMVLWNRRVPPSWGEVDTECRCIIKQAYLFRISKKLKRSIKSIPGPKSSILTEWARRHQSGLCDQSHSIKKLSLRKRKDKHPSQKKHLVMLATSLQIWVRSFKRC